MMLRMDEAAAAAWRQRFSVGYSGDLYITGSPWILRRAYRWHFSRISRPREVLACLRAGPHTWPGGYPLYFITEDGAALSFDTVRDNLRSVMWDMVNECNTGWRMVACEVNWEDPRLVDDHTGKRIPSAYAEDEAEKEG